MKIAQLCLSPDLGGLELYVYKLATFLGENCLSYINANGKLLPYYQDSNLFFRQLKTKYKFNLLVNAKKLASWIDKDQIDILHIHWTKDLPLAVLAKLFSKKKPKLVHTRHMQMVGSKDDFFHRFLYSHVDKMIAITDQLKDQMECFLPKKNRPEIIRLYIGAQAPIILNKSIINEKRNHLGLKQDTFTVGIIGRIEEAKGQHVVLDALLALDNEKINIKGLVVGGAMDDKYFSFIKEKYAKVAHFLGFTKEAQMTMQLCDVVVLATKNETFGLVLVEAMLGGVCVLASDSGGPLEIINDNSSGLLFKTFQSCDLAEKLKYLYLDPDLRKKLASNGHEKALKDFNAPIQFLRLKQEVYDLFAKKNLNC